MRGHVNRIAGACFGLRSASLVLATDGDADRVRGNPSTPNGFFHLSPNQLILSLRLFGGVKTMECGAARSLRFFFASSAVAQARAS